MLGAVFLLLLKHGMFKGVTNQSSLVVDEVNSTFSLKDDAIEEGG